MRPLSAFFIAISFVTTNGNLFISRHSNQAPAKWPTLNGLPPVLFGHGGEKFYLPEHTTGSYWLAAVEGADYVEPDVVLTKDRVPVCFHDIALKRSTDVEDHPEFAHLRGNHSVVLDGIEQIVYDDWLVIHFTLEQLKTLRVQQQPNGVRLQDFNELYPISTFQEFLDVIHESSLKLGRPIGLIPELKHPHYHNTVFDNIDHLMETLVLGVLRANGYPLNSGDQPNCMSGGEQISCGSIILQNFNHTVIQYFSTVTSHPSVELMTLVHPNVYLLTHMGFAEMANYSDYICLMKEYMYTGVDAEIAFKGWEYDLDLVDLMGGFLKPEEFIPEAHRLGVKMTLFTIPDSRESSGRGCAVECDPVDKEEELFYYFNMGIDGMFVENIPETLTMRLKFDYELKLANMTYYYAQL